MGKGNLILGSGSGKLGDTIFYRKDGIQKFRIRVHQILNPKTNAQAVQRVAMQTLSQIQSALSEIVDHSFENVQRGKRSLDYFMKKNMSIISRTLRISFNDSSYSTVAAGAKGSVSVWPQKVMVSNGSLQSCPVQWFESGFWNKPYILMGNEVTRYSPGIAPSDGLTMRDMINTLGMQEPFSQITFMLVYSDETQDLYENKICKFGFARLVRNGLTMDRINNLDYPFTEVNASDAFDMSKTTPEVCQALEVSSQDVHWEIKDESNYKCRLPFSTHTSSGNYPCFLVNLVMGFDFSFIDNEAVMFTTIKSEFKNGKWKRSCDYLLPVIDESRLSEFGDLRKGVESYQFVTDPVSGEYLNNG